MYVNLSYEMLSRLRRSRQVLSDEGLRLLEGYVLSQKTGGDTFLSRGGREDLYYTMFGWTLALACFSKTSFFKRLAYLGKMEREGGLDELHEEVLRLLRKLHGALLMLPLGILGHDLDVFFRRYLEHTGPDSTNALAARLCLEYKRSGGRCWNREDVVKLLDAQDETGGFLANAQAPVPDVLSTGVALFALNLLGERPRYGAEDFFLAHFKEDGGFMPTLLDDQSDVEYVFYALLGLGSC